MKHHLMRLQAIAESKLEYKKKAGSIIAEVKLEKEIKQFKIERQKA